MILRATLLVALLLPAWPEARAEVPTLLSYQGRVASGNVNFTGSGGFKFALVDGQTGDTLWSHDGTSVAGSEPTSAIALSVERGNFDVLLGQTQIANMTQPLPPAALANGRARLRVWFNDGSNGSQRLAPDTRLAASGYAQRAASLGAGAVTAASLAAGSVGPAALAAGSVTGAALAAGSVGATQLAAGAVGSAQLAAGAVGSAQLAPGVAAANLAASGLAAVPTGGIVLSETRENVALQAAGFVRIGQTQLVAEGWTQLRSGPFSNYDTLTSAISGSSVTWTGREVIRWGGFQGTVAYVDSGARYDPRRDVARTTTLHGGPARRARHSAVWTGSELIVWGGNNQLANSFKNDGARYDPVLDRWAPMTLTGAPTPRSGHSAVWTGSEMIVWGGTHVVSPNTVSTNTGARYSPATDTWTATTLTNPPEVRTDHSAVWTGSEMLIWGNIGGSFPNRGSRYDPVADTWTHFSTTGAPPGRKGHGLVWSGTHLLIWGGYVLSGGVEGTAVPAEGGARYHLATDTWLTLNATGGPAATLSPGVTWTGARLLAFNGTSAAAYDPQADLWSPLAGGPVLESVASPTYYLDHLRSVWTGTEWYLAARQPTGGPVFARYHFARNAWEPMLAEPTDASGAISSTLPQRRSHTGLWTGRELLVIGGLEADGIATAGPSFRFDPVTRFVRSANLPTGGSAPDVGLTAVWTGGQALLFGRRKSSNATFSYRYDPLTDLSTPLSASGEPAYRTRHTAVWTGSEMIVFGGQPFNTGGTPYGDGARYSAGANSWTALPATGRPSARAHHGAVWTGSQMIVWGGQGTGSVALADGARFEVQSNTWTALPTLGAPAARSRHASVWTGTQLIVWGGRGADGQPRADGAVYEPAGDRWRPLPPAPTGFAARELPYVCWTGSELLLLGGVGADGEPLTSGARYEPSGATWSAIDPRYAVPARLDGSFTWTGSEALYVGGQATGVEDDFYLPFMVFDDVHSYRPPRTSWLFQRP